MILRVEDLDRLAAQEARAHGCLVLHGRCHPGAPLVVSYEKGSGLLCVSCRQCARVIAEVAVAGGDNEVTA